MRFDVEPLPEAPLAAAARFHAEVLPRIQDITATHDCLTVVFTVAEHSHRGWRLAAVQELARAAAPRRVNAVASNDEAATAAAVAYLSAAPGVTGQLLPLDGNGAGPVLLRRR